MNSLFRYFFLIGRILFIIIVALGLLVGAGFWLAPAEVKETSVAPPGTIYSCSMHPQIRSPRGGTCPICGMQLIPISAESRGAGTSLDGAARKVANIETLVIARRPAELRIHTIGHFDTDERTVARLVAWTDGRVEKLYIPFAGSRVAKGDPIVDLYVPSLPAIISELKTAKALGEGVYKSVKERLYRYGIADPQIDEWERQDSISPRFTLRAPVGGIVMERQAQLGMMLKEGDPIAQLASLETIALDIEIYEKDLAFIGPGSKATITVDALPGEKLETELEYLKPFAQSDTRTVHGRAFIKNPRGLARPNMWFSVEFKIPVDANGRPIQVRKSEFTETPAESAPANTNDPLLVPASAVLDLGARKLVYLETGEGRYEPRAVTLGPRTGDHYILLSGLVEGSRVVSRGAFLVDSQAQIEGRPSLLFPEGAGGEQHK